MQGQQLTLCLTQERPHGAFPANLHCVKMGKVLLQQKFHIHLNLRGFISRYFLCDTPRPHLCTGIASSTEMCGQSQAGAFPHVVLGRLCGTRALGRCHLPSLSKYHPIRFMEGEIEAESHIYRNNCARGHFSEVTGARRNNWSASWVSVSLHGVQ